MSESTMVGVDLPPLVVTVEPQAGSMELRLKLLRRLGIMALIGANVALPLVDAAGRGLYYAQPGQHPLRLLVLSTSTTLVVSTAYKLPRTTFYAIGLLRSMASFPVSYLTGKQAKKTLTSQEVWRFKKLRTDRSFRLLNLVAGQINRSTKHLNRAVSKLDRPKLFVSSKIQMALDWSEGKDENGQVQHSKKIRRTSVLLMLVAMSCFIPFYGMPVVDIAAAREDIGWKTIAAVLLPAKLCKLYLLYKVGHTYDLNLLGHLEHNL